MSHPTFKSFFALIILTALLTVVAVYLPQFLPQPQPVIREVSHIKPVTDDGSLPFIEANAPFNLSNDEQLLNAGTFGVLTAVVQNESTGVITLKFDQTKLLKGEEAEKAARVDSGCDKPGPPAKCAESLTVNGQYISNPIKKVFEYKLSPDAEIRLLTDGNAQTGTGVKLSQPVDLAKLLVVDKTTAPESQKLTIPVWIKEKNGIVTYVEQQLWQK